MVVIGLTYPQTQITNDVGQVSRLLNFVHVGTNERSRNDTNSVRLHKTRRFFSSTVSTNLSSRLSTSEGKGRIIFLSLAIVLSAYFGFLSSLSSQLSL